MGADKDMEAEGRLLHLKWGSVILNIPPRPLLYALPPFSGFVLHI